MGSGGWRQQKCTHPCHPPLPTQPHLCTQHCHRSNGVPTSFMTKPVQRKWLGSTTTAAARGGRGLHGPMAFPNHLSFVRTQKWIWGPSILLGFWDHPPRTTAWGKLVKVTHRPPAPHSPAPSWTTGHHWVPPAAAPRARKVGPNVLAQNYFSWSLFGPKFRPMGQMLHWQCPFPTQSARGTQGGRPPPPPEHFPCL